MSLNQRITSKVLEAEVEDLNRIVSNMGSEELILDHHAGGYRLGQQVAPGGGGIRYISPRLGARELYIFIRGIGAGWGL